MTQQQAGTRLGLVRCEHCGRQFNAHSGARHIPWCARQQSESKKHRLSQEKKLALERYKWRISYKPSNRFVAPSSTTTSAGRQAFPMQDRSGCSKKSSASINSSATLSSPSASSTNSLGGGSSLNGYNILDRHATASHVQQQQARTAARNRAAPPQRHQTQPLKRSISSLTLTKQRGTLEPSADNNNANTRTKSTNDVSRQDMSEIVENLARRMEQIYAQNQLLLDRISKSRPPSSARSRQRSRRDSDDDNEESTDSELASMMLSCHHCKSSCLGLANYCHKCGCKLHSPAATAATKSPG